MSTVGRHGNNDSRNGYGVLAAVIVVAGLGILTGYTFLPWLIRTTCHATQCAPRPMAVAGWAAFAGLPLGVGAVVAAYGRVPRPVLWIVVTVAVLFSLPAIGVLPSRGGYNPTLESLAQRQGGLIFLAGFGRTFWSVFVTIGAANLLTLLGTLAWAQWRPGSFHRLGAQRILRGGALLGGAAVATVTIVVLATLLIRPPS